MLTYYRTKMENKGMHLRSYVSYLSAVVLAGIVAILVVIGSFCELQRYSLYSQIVDYSYLALCLLNVVSLLQLKFKFGI